MGKAYLSCAFGALARPMTNTFTNLGGRKQISHDQRRDSLTLTASNNSELKIVSESH